MPVFGWCVLLSVLLVGEVIAQPENVKRDISQLDILKPIHPRAFFFRASEAACVERRYPTYESWERDFDRLQGIIGKCLDEECIGRQKRNPEFFSRFKQRHPQQAVLLHFNGNSRDPRYEADRYFAGHWIYRQATMVIDDVPAVNGEVVIKTENARDFRVKMGRYKTSNDDIALFRMKEDGTHDWHYCEQVQLISVDYMANAIKVKRGCYGTTPLAFEGGKTRVAAHQVEGPWGRTNNLLWYYNFTTHSPRDANGKSCADLLVDDLARWFGPTGRLAAFDGLEFDVMYNQTHGDTDGDGAVDHGVIDGVNQYGIGIVEFARQLRERMTDNFVIQGDGALGRGGSRSQRAWQLLNGIESEGWPNLNDWEFDDWSGGLNRHFFWQQNARPPVFNYVNHKWIESVRDQPGVHRHPEVSFARHRLALAACQFFDAMTCYSFAPRNDENGRYGIWDELVCGIENQVGWLGAPDGPPVRLASQQADLLDGAGQGSSLVSRITGQVNVGIGEEGVRVVSESPDAKDTRFRVSNIPTRGNELLVAVEMSADQRVNYPAEMARFATVGVSGGERSLLADPPIDTGMRIRGEEHEVPVDRGTGAFLQNRSAEIAGETLPAMFVHPPYRNGVGYAFWTQEADVPQDADLRFSIGMGLLSPTRSDGVRFQIFASDCNDENIGPAEKLFDRTTKDHRWIPQTVSMSKYAGKRVRLKFVADCGPGDNSTTDHAYWGDARIVQRGLTRKEITPPKQYMTWVNDKTFQSTFYFRDIRSDHVDLSFVVEGAEPITIHSVTAHAYPDVIYRVFDGGIVLANPSFVPYTIDLKKVLPRRTYRRIQATSEQDVKTNNGRTVQGELTLGERDALFLRRVLRDQ